MKIFGMVGWSGSGKTTLMVRLLPELIARGISVSTMKHTHHNVDLDQPGKDSYEHREAGAHEVLIASSNRWALTRELHDEPEPDMDELIARMEPVDLLLIEGFKKHRHAKLEIHRADTQKSLIGSDEPTIVAIASDEPLDDVTVPVLDLNDVAAIADFIVDFNGIGGKKGQANDTA
ncbi:MAG: molybdopterin-guanine dinucleotide biosynthesis protein B [Rhodospirillaceae bacterium]|nr:molybdopterin-guanine dinucleotide biosynthesis protein B [Rhodospirillaceae bacterium]MBT4220557.1 molybdopterin-guanine dinucleotide biosynthesis protein B [Rhodospirillaceae bacterium]MBT4463241.1 molybdopterin-guanine dinucleotide biosynthesis protein B [Rhodospirillaceae bacterium]MBT5014720.1 molybdopterin-guanine dinucleotide biosynthesis protein B [Rhodospirillaceae bacterium]MBT5309738.1 molybdopterin-guanine dinucleotide biosynthesis protein B [Rhodospirillaceae bacterium]